MNKLMISGDDLKAIGFREGKAIGAALNAALKYFGKNERRKAIEALRAVLADPEAYLSDEVFGETARILTEPPPSPEPEFDIPLEEKSSSYSLFGDVHIEEGARTQMEIAMKLPVTVAGALMPDAHQGYGLPIGGVLATENAVIPYGVGVDIGCRMCLSVFDIPVHHFIKNPGAYKRELIAHSRFGAGASWTGREQVEHEILGRPEFHATPFLSGLFKKAAGQLGTSGGGNHFVEWGILEMLQAGEEPLLPPGKYLALLSHSGSRGFGASVASYYTKIAKQLCRLPQEAKNLAYLGLDSAEGQEYWMAMNLAGDYAAACHDVIHRKLTSAIGAQALLRVENHHNFAWKETHEGKEVIVHRKGATPASKGMLGIIPGSMTAPGFLVRGKGEARSLHSASHGAGRQMSRTQAIKNIRHEEMKKILKDHGVTLIGAGTDEAPMAYKDIHKVMEAQSELVEVLAKFKPKIVRMADDGSRED